MFAPAISPHNPNLMFVSCDMGGLYRSENGGASWHLLDVRMVRGSTTSAPVFHPKDRSIVYHADEEGLKISKDEGKTFKLYFERAPWGDSKIRKIYIDGMQGRIMFVGLENGAYVSTDAGASWRKCAGVEGETVGFYVALDESLFIATRSGIFCSAKGGFVWIKQVQGLPSDLRIRSFCGGWDSRTGKSVIYCVTPTKGNEGGIYRSTDSARNWKRVMGGGINAKADFKFVACAENDGTVVYATCEGSGDAPPEHFTVWKSVDSGENWEYVYNGDPNFKKRNVETGWLAYDFNWGWGGPALGFCVARNNSHYLLHTDSGQVHLSRDGAAHWTQVFSRFADEGQPSKGKRWTSCGLEVTTVWGVYFDPNNLERIFICYTDIGFARSEDGGKTWYSSIEGSPWKNSFYELEFDTKSKRIYAAAADQHDIPHWTQIEDEKGKGGGGVVFSDDEGKSWKVLGKELPQGPCTSVAINPKTKGLYCVIYGRGVFKYDASEDKWNDITGDLAKNRNPHYYKIKFHSDGTLFCLITGWRQGKSFDVKGGLWQTRDDGKTWKCLTEKLNLFWPMGFDFDPSDSNVIYIAHAAAPQRTDGGLLKTTDGGKNWKELSVPYNRKYCSYVHAYAPLVDKRNPKVVFLATATHGLFVSTDSGKNWTEITSIPFLSVHSVTFNPKKKDEAFVSTMGAGVFRIKLPISK